MDPMDPADPADPADPVDPVDPSDPADPADPADPTDPSDPSDPSDPTDPTDPQVACFEAGVKFGSLYHQFAGTPVSPASAARLERAMETAIENQPYCVDVTVELLDDEIASAADKEYGYAELTGRFVEAVVEVEYEDVVVVAEMRMDDGYPRMRVTEVSEASEVSEVSDAEEQ